MEFVPCFLLMFEFVLVCVDFSGIIFSVVYWYFFVFWDFHFFNDCSDVFARIPTFRSGPLRSIPELLYDHIWSYRIIFYRIDRVSITWLPDSKNQAHFYFWRKSIKDISQQSLEKSLILVDWFSQFSEIFPLWSPWLSHNFFCDVFSNVQYFLFFIHGLANLIETCEDSSWLHISTYIYPVGQLSQFFLALF